MLSRLQRNIPYTFSQVKLLEAAITHSSFANESENGQEHNERLEFLGDAVLELCISESLFGRFSGVREGTLTAMRSQLVKQETLAGLARKLELPMMLRLGKGEDTQGGRERETLLSDAFEALLGAIFLDGGYPAAQKVVWGLFAGLWPEEQEKRKPKDFKSRLQECTQQISKGRPVYVPVDSFGPEHDKLFTVRVELPDGREFTGEGGSMKRAEQNAAAAALSALGEA